MFGAVVGTSRRQDVHLLSIKYTALQSVSWRGQRFGQPCCLEVVYDLYLCNKNQTNSHFLH